VATWVGIVITVGAYPEVLPADGKSTSFIVAKVTDEKGKPIAGKEVMFSSTGGQILVKRVRTNEQGLAFSRICSELLQKGQRKVVKIRAKVNPEAEIEVIFDGDMVLTLNTSNVSVYAFCYWKKITPNGPWVCTPKPPYCECCEEENGVSGLAGIAMHVVTPLGYWTAYPNYIEVIGDGHPNQFRSDYDRDYFDYDQNAPCPPPPDPSNPNQQRFHFSWQPETTLGWVEFHRSPVTIKINYTVGRYYPYPPQFWTETKTFVVNAFNAVLKIEPNSPKVLAWDPENPDPSKLTVNFEVETLQIGRVWVWMRIYSCKRANNEGAIRVIQTETTTNTPTPIAWDGRDDSGEVAEKGLYAYDLHVCVEQLSPECVDRDVKVSQYLSVERAVDEEGNEIFDAEYYGYDDKGTEEVEDDDHLYFIRWYVLRDKEGRDANEGSEIWLFDPDLNFVKAWRVKELPCLEHGGEKDGLKASEGGMRHGILVAVPVSLMEKAGTYYFVLHFLDNHPDKYKDHKVKPALEINQRAILLPPIVYISGTYFPPTDGLRGFRWHGAWCRIPNSVFKTTQYFSSHPQWQTVINWIIQRAFPGSGTVQVGVNGGFFSGDFIVGHVGTGQGWEGYDMLVRRWNFGMRLMGSDRFIERMVLVSGTRSTYTIDRRVRNYPYGLSGIGVLIWDGTAMGLDDDEDGKVDEDRLDSGGDSEQIDNDRDGQVNEDHTWPNALDRDARTFIAWDNRGHFYLFVFEGGENWGVSWGEVVTFLHQELPRWMREDLPRFVENEPAYEGARVSPQDIVIRDAIMLDGGGSTQFIWRWARKRIRRDGSYVTYNRPEPEGYTVEGRKVPTLVDAYAEAP